ncbi:phosphoribosylformylglycinamidine synthase subunit PurL [Candidatus Marinamargulisbacteria bacterium SCGC AG-343-K17]|nr:phosphoribosylformylglycinamidine synthase subunit PurL [Candidatus Marinamargulisbacteria bacterium SCGC AG-343-K17]
MALSESDKQSIQNLLGRDASAVELSIFDTMWSEHCSYKSSKPVLKTLPTKGPNIMLGVGEDSGIIEFATHNGDKYGIAVSHESHNHPSQVLPVEGAATGVGGVVRDVYCMGADVIGVLDSLHFGIPEDDGYHLVNHIADNVVKGVSDYGNPLGVPNVGGETIYHESYNENCLVNVAAIGLVREDKIIRSKVPEAAKTTPYVMILLGKTTDATGYGGASFSSTILDADDEQQNLGAVQVHDPFMKRVLVVAIEDMLDYAEKEGIEIGFKDLGAGGISCATSELAVAGGFGCELNLNNVPVVDPTLDPEIIACSETQERFCVVVPESHAKAVCDIFNVKHDMSSLYPGAGAAVIGTIIQEPQYRIKVNNELICDLPVSAITTEVLADRKVGKKTIERGEDTPPSNINHQAVALSMLSQLNNTQKKYVYRHYDQFVKNNGVVIPGEADACVLAPIDGSPAGVAVTIDSNTYGTKDPYVSGAYAVAESIRNVIAVGAEPIALTDCLNYGNPEKPDVFYDFNEGVRGIGDAARQLSTHDDVVPIISGNVSFYNESATGQAVVPSPVICCIGRMPIADDAHRMQLSHEGAHVVLVGRRYHEFAETQLSATLKEMGDNHEFSTVPQVRFEEEKAMNQAMLTLNRDQRTNAVHDISQGGVWQALIEMVAGDRNWPFVGLELNCPTDTNEAAFLFSENAGYLCEVLPENYDACKQVWDAHGVYAESIGVTTAGADICINGPNGNIIKISMDQALKEFNSKNLATPGTPIYNKNII